MKKTIFITGASTGIGKATAIEFAKEGHNLILCARQIDKLETIKEMLEKQYEVTVEVHKLDVTDYDAVKQLSEKLKQSNVNIDVSDAAFVGFCRKKILK